MTCPYHAKAGLILRVRDLFGIRRKSHPMCGGECHTTIEEVFVNFLKLILKIIQSGSVWTGMLLYWTRLLLLPFYIMKKKI